MSRGGKSAALTIQLDEDWKKLFEDLAHQPYRRVVDISMTLDNEIWGPRFAQAKLVGLSIHSGSQSLTFPRGHSQVRSRMKKSF